MTSDDAVERYTAELERLWQDASGRDVPEVEVLVRDWAAIHKPYLSEIDLAFTARVMSDPRWARKHPLSALALAWKYRAAQSPLRSIRWLWRPRFTG